MANIKNFKNKKIIFLLIIAVMTIPIEVDALVPVTYTCCYNYTFNDGVQLNNFEDNPLGGIQIDNFEDLNNWTVYNGIKSPDTINFKEGQQGLKLTVSSVAWGAITKTINYNFSNTDTFGIWVYIDSSNLSTFNYMNIIFSSTTDFSKYFQVKYQIRLNAGWNKLIISKGDFIPIGNENWNNIMIRARLTLVPNSGQITSVTFDDFRYNVTTQWKAGTNSSIQADTINFKEGQQGLKLIATNGIYAYMDLPINNNFSKTNNFIVWAYVNNASNHNGIWLYMTSNISNSFGIGSNYFWDSEWNAVKTGWNRLIFNKNNFRQGNDTYPESWNNAMKIIRLAIKPDPNTNLSVSFDDLRYNMTGTRAKLMITIDDGGISTYSKAYPILNKNNQTAVAFIVTSYVDDGVDMTLSNLKTLQNAGWDISSHLIHHYDMTLLDDSTLTTEINGSYDWFVSNNFQKSAGFLAYPDGYFNDHIIDMVKKRYMLARATQRESAQQHFIPEDDSIRYIQRTITLNNDTTVQSVKDSINATIDSKLLGIMYMHKFADTNPTNDIYTTITSDFQKMSDYIKSRSADIDVITYSDYIIPNIKSFTPIINKTTRIYSNGTSVIITKNKYDEYMPNITVMPSFGYIDIGVTIYNESGGLIKFNESSSSSDLQVSYSIGDRIPNRLYSVKIYWANDTLYQNFNIMANSTGYINYNSIGFGNSRYQEINTGGIVDTSFTATLPVGYTFLRFNVPNATLTNFDPDGQNSLQPIFNITNNGNIIQNFTFYLNGTITNITNYADLDNDHSMGRIEINTTHSIIISNLNPGSSQNVWMIIDAKNAPSINVNKTLTINSN